MIRIRLHLIPLAASAALATLVYGGGSVLAAAPANIPAATSTAAQPTTQVNASTVYHPGSAVLTNVTVQAGTVGLGSASPNMVCGPQGCVSQWMYEPGPYDVNVDQYLSTHGYWTPQWQNGIHGCLGGITVDGIWQGYKFLAAVQAGAAPELSIGEFAFMCVAGATWEVFFTG